jgi:hypothetical protein
MTTQINCCDCQGNLHGDDTLTVDSQPIHLKCFRKRLEARSSFGGWVKSGQAS